MYKMSSSLRSRREALNRVSCASLVLLAGCAVNAGAQVVTAYNNTTGGAFTYDPLTPNDWLDDVTTIGTGSASKAYWTINTISGAVVNNTASRQTYYIDMFFYSSVNTSPATGSTICQGNFITGFDYGTQVIAAGVGRTSIWSVNIASLEEAIPAGQTVGVEIEIANSTNAALNSAVFPAFYGNGQNSAVSVGSSSPNFFQDTNGDGNFEGSEEYQFLSPGNGEGNLYLSFTANASTPAPNALPIMVAGAAPLLGLLRRRRARRSAGSTSCAPVSARGTAEGASSPTSSV